MFEKAQKFNWLGLVGLHILAVLLGCTWMLTELRRYWEELDRAVFFFLNGTVALGDGWTFLWAISNNRYFDLIPLIFLALPFLVPGTVYKNKSIHFRLLQFIVLVKTAGLCRRLLVYALDYDRLSPTLVLKPAHRVSEIMPFINAKDQSLSSFSGDHAVILVVWAAFIFITAEQKKWGWFCSAIAVLFMLPRLAGGAHWLTDNIIGAGCIALCGLAWAGMTPLSSKIANWLLPYYVGVLGFFSRFCPISINPHVSPKKKSLY
jgi:membrane-associated phospholipid phosphatase